MRMNIHRTAEAGDTQRVKDLLDRARRKVSVDARDKSGFTPLHFAARNGHTEIVALLRERGGRQ